MLTLGSPASCSIGIAQGSPDDWHRTMVSTLGAGATPRSERERRGHPLTHEQGRLIRREYFQSGGILVSRELLDAAGFVTESIRFRPADGQPVETDHWWFERGVPVRQVSGRDEFFKKDEQWISKATGKSWVRE